VVAELEDLAGRAIELAPAQPPIEPSDRPRFRAVFYRYDREANPFSGWYDNFVGLVDIVNLETGRQHAAYQRFALGRQFESLGDLEQGDIIELNAAIGENGTLKQPTRLTVMPK
jgi:hypothetical protein